MKTEMCVHNMRLLLLHAGATQLFLFSITQLFLFFQRMEKEKEWKKRKMLPNSRLVEMIA